MAKKEKAPSIADRLEQIQETLKELKERDDKQKESGPSLPPSAMQREIERVAPALGIDRPRSWPLTKDIGRAFIPSAQIEALARSNLRGETYEAAKSKAEDAREDLENRRPNLFAVGQATTWVGSLGASLYLYSKFLGAGTGAKAVDEKVGRAVAAGRQVATRAATAARVARAAPKNPIGLAIAASIGLGSLAVRSGRTATRFYRSGPKAGMTETYRKVGR